MSVGHLARLIEAAGIPTVVAASTVFRPRLEALRPARLLLTRSLMGRTLGAPGEDERHYTVVKAALGLLESATAGETVLEMDAV